MISGIVAIIGRPNVGKSTIFNQIINERKSIAEDTLGVTRDRIYGRAEWLTRELQVIDTRGIQLANQDFQTEINIQVEIAIDETDCIIFIISSKDGLTHDDKCITRLLHKTKEPVILTVDKMNDFAQSDAIYEFYNLGLGDPLAVSGTHGIGIGGILDAVIHALSEKEKDEYDGMTKPCVIGRPNVGKSSPVDVTLNQERVTVSNIEGTTRDAINTPFKREDKEYVVIDITGIRKRGKVYGDTERYSALRAMSAIGRSDVVLVVIDGEKGVRDQDKYIVGYTHETGESIVIVYNKWDAVKKDEQTMYTIEKEIRAQFLYLSCAPVPFVSALKKQRIHTILPVIDEVYDYSVLRIQTNISNEVIMNAQLVAPPSTHKEQRLKIYYASQVFVAPPTFVLFVNDPELLHFSYKWYLKSRLREAFGFTGTTLRVLARERNR